MDGNHQYRSDQRNGLKAALGIAGACLCFVACVLSALALFLAPPEKMSGFETAVISALAVMTFLSAAYAVAMLRSPVRAVLDDEGIVIEGLVSRRRLAWRQVARLRREKASQLFGGAKLDVLLLCDERGATLASVNSRLERFPDLVADIERRSSLAHGGATYDRGADLERRRRKSLKSLRFVQIVLALFWVLSIVLGSWGILDRRNEIRLARGGVETDARIVKRWLRGATPRLSYAVAGADGREHTRNTMMTREAWDALEGAGTVRVRTLPDDPDLSRLVAGETEVNDAGTMMAVGLISAVFWGGLLVFALLGYDVDIQDGKMRLKRHGEVSDEFERPPPGPAAPAAPPPAPAVIVEAESGAPPAVRTGIPGGILAIGVLNLVFGGLGMLGGALQLVSAHLVAGLPGATAAFDPALLMAVAGLRIVFSAMMLVSAVGLFLARYWGLRLALLSATGRIALGLVGIASALVSAAGQSGQVGAQGDAAFPMGLLGTLLLLGLGLVYPAVVLVVLGRRSARESFGRNAGR